MLAMDDMRIGLLPAAERDHQCRPELSAYRTILLPFNQEHHHEIRTFVGNTACCIDHDRM